MLTERENCAAAPVGATIEVRLIGHQPNTAWEIGLPIDDVLEPAPNTAFPEFISTEGPAESSIGTYIFRFRAMRAGKAMLRFEYLYPAGRERERRRTKRVRSAEFLVEVLERSG